MAKIEVPLRAIIENPPPGAMWALQRSKGDLSDLWPPTRSSADRLEFEFSVQAERADDGALRLLGPCVQGPPQGRFFYLNSGGYAGEPASHYGRRAKIALGAITWPMIEALVPGQRLEVRIAGKAKDGGPACATVPLLAPAWRAA